jgi:hypothetical protein
VVSRKDERPTADLTANATPDGRRAHLSAEAWFADCTMLDDEWKEYIEQQCFDDGAIAFMDRHPRFDCWVFHTLYRRDMVLKKNIAELFEQQRSRQFTERDMEDEICRHLASVDIPFERQVPCGIGIADIVTGTAVYELKLSVCGSSIFTAVGQALAYRRILGRPHAVILTKHPPKRAVRIGRLVKVQVLDYHDAIQKGAIR